MLSMQRSGLYKRCAAFALVVMLCLLPLVSMAGGEAAYGTISARSLNLRAEPNADSAILASYPSGTWVQVLETTGGWYKVQIDSLVGYMSAKYVSLNNVTKVTDAKVSGANGYINLRASASANAAVLATYPNGTRVKILSHANGFYQVQVGNMTGFMADHLVKLDSVKVQTYAVIRTANGGNLNLRTAPSYDAQVIQSFAPGQQVAIVEKGKSWHKVRVNGVTGYMSAEFLVIGGKPAPAPQPATTKVGVVNNPRDTQVLNLRETASLDARVLAYYYNGKQVEILGSIGDWYQVKVDGVIGYMMKNYIKVTSNTPVPATPATPFAAKLKNPNGGSIVNFRREPGLNTKVLAVYPVGKDVTVLSYYNADWAQVSIDGITGYVSSYFLKY